MTLLATACADITLAMATSLAGKVDSATTNSDVAVGNPVQELKCEQPEKATRQGSPAEGASADPVQSASQAAIATMLSVNGGRRAPPGA